MNRNGDIIEIEPVAHIENGFTDKFGIPRQGSLAGSTFSKIVFEEKYRDKNAVRGIEQYSHLWLLWGFSENFSEGWSPTVRPPRLGGNIRVGVFASRSPFRPNPVGLSCVKLEKVEESAASGSVLVVSGADMMNGTPIYDIKPYIPYADCAPDASGGFSSEHTGDRVEVVFESEAASVLPECLKKELSEVLSYDPRPSYQNDEMRRYGFSFYGYEIKFRVSDGVLTVVDAYKEGDTDK